MGRCVKTTKEAKVSTIKFVEPLTLSPAKTALCIIKKFRTLITHNSEPNWLNRYII